MPGCIEFGGYYWYINVIVNPNSFTVEYRNHSKQKAIITSTSYDLIDAYYDVVLQLVEEIQYRYE